MGVGRTAAGTVALVAAALLLALLDGPKALVAIDGETAVAPAPGPGAAAGSEPERALRAE